MVTLSFGSLKQVFRTHPGLAIFATALLTRLAFYALILPSTTAVLEPDSSEYLAIATNLLNSGSFMRFEQCIDLKRTPIYPLFLLISGATTNNYMGVVLLQVLLSSLSAVLVHLSAMRLDLGHRSALVAGLVMALEPLTIVYCSILLSETLFLFLITVLIFHWVTITAKPSPSNVDVVSVGGITSLLILTKPVALVCLPALILAIFVTYKRSSIKQYLALSGLLALGFLPLGAWMTRNYVHCGSPIISTISSTNLMDYRACGILATINNKSFAETRAAIRQQFGRDDQPLSAQEQLQMALKKRQAALRILSQHPKIVIKQCVRGTAVIALAPGAGIALKSVKAHPGGTGIYHAVVTLNFKKMSDIWRKLAGKRIAVILALLVFGGFYVVFYASVGLGTWKMCFNPGLRHRLILIVCLVAPLCLAAAGPEAEPRFRLPIIPFLALIIAHLFAQNSTSPEVQSDKITDVKNENAPAIQTCE